MISRECQPTLLASSILFSLGVHDQEAYANGTLGKAYGVVGVVEWQR